MSEFLQAHFTTPNDLGSANHLALFAELVRATPPGEAIHACISHFENCDVLTALREAGERGVTLRLVIRSDAPVLADPAALPSGEITTGMGCFGDSIHSKFLLFSRTTFRGTELRNLSVVGSGILTPGSAKKQENHVLVGDEAFYRALLDHWSRMRARCTDGATPTNVAGTFHSTTNKVKAYLFPFRNQDIVLDILNNIRSTRRARTDQRPILRVAMARWLWSRRELATPLVKGVLLGSLRLELVLRPDESNGVSPKYITWFKVLARTFPKQVVLHVGALGTPSRNVHSKYFVFEGYYGEGNAWERLVFTGSTNWTNEAQTDNDEIMVKIRDDAIFASFTNNHELLKQLCPRA